MISEIFSTESFFWSCLWQSTTFIVIGLAGSFILRHRSARAHQVLLLAIIAAVIVPVISALVKHYELGLFAAKPAIIQSQPEDQIIYETAEITSVENIEHKLGIVEKDLTSVITASEDTKFPLRSILLYGWLAASLALAFRLAVTFILGVRLLGRAMPLDYDRIEQAIHPVKVKLRINKDVMVYSSDGVRSPVIWCWRHKPTLLLPSAAGQSNNRINLAGVLCHELAHYKRRDHISGLLVELVLCILPWHPLLWWAKSRLIKLSEQACDDWVVATGQPCTDYAESLLDLTPCGQMAFVPAVVSNKKGLAGRVHRILKNNCPNPRTGALWALTVTIAAVCITFGVALAQARPASNDEAEIETPSVTEKLKNNALPVSWKLDYDDGLLPGGAKHWLGQMAEDLASLKVVPKSVDPNEEYKFNIHSLQGKKMGSIHVMPEAKFRPQNLKILKPDKYFLKYERRWGNPGNNFRMKCGEFLVDLSQPGMYELRFDPKLWTAKITGSLGGCYAINFEKVGKGPRIQGFAYQHGRPYLLDGLPAGKYQLSAVTQRQSDNVFVSQAEVTVGAQEKATVDIVPAPKGSCSLQGYILGKQKKYKTPWPKTWPESQGKWYILIRKWGSGAVEWVDAYEALTMDSLYVVRGTNIKQETEDRTRYHIEGVVPDKYTVTAIENPSWSGCIITRQQSKTLTLRAGDEAVLDFDLRGIQQQQKDLSAETEGAKAKEGESGEVRFVHFPNDRSLGTLYIRDIGSESWYKDWEKLDEAKGTVVIPHNKEVKLEVSEEAARDLSPLATLRADDLQMLSFGWKAVRAGSLAPIGNLKGLKALNIQRAMFDSDDFKHLTGLAQLQVLRFGDHNLTDGSMRYVGQLTSLRSLALWGTGITDEGLKHLQGLTNLTFLALNNCEITDQGLNYLRNMTALEGLQISRTKITDNGLEKLRGLTRLKHIKLGGNGITDAGLKHIENLTSLENIWIDSNPITDKGLSYLAGMKNLKELYALHTEITDAGLANLKGVKDIRFVVGPGTAEKIESARQRVIRFPEGRSMGKLFVRDAGPDSWYKDWEKLDEAKGTVVIPHKKEVKLEVSEEAAGNLSPLATLRADDLQMLCFGWKPVKIGSLEPIGNLRGLKALNLQTAKFNSEDFKHLTELSQLEVLRLGDQQLTDGSMKYIGQLISLRSLALWGTGISDEGLKHLQDLNNLTFLALNNCKITDEGLNYLKNMTALEGLQLTQTKITDKGLAKLKNFTRLKSLLIGYTNITDEGLEHLQTLTSLEIIWINSTPITDQGIAYLHNMKNLKELYASRTKITDVGLAHLKDLRMFRHLTISGIGDGGIQHLSKLPALEMIQILDTQVTKASIPYFKKMGSIKEVLLSGDKIDDDLLGALRTTLPDCKIWDPQRSRDYPMAEWRQRFEAVYRLEEGQILKRISPPFIPERRDYYLNEYSHQASLVSRSPDRFVFHWDRKLKRWGYGFINTPDINSTLRSVLGLNTFEYDGPEELLSLKLPGDWIVCDGTSKEMKLKALEQLLADELGRPVRFEKRTVEQEVIVTTGRFKFHPVPRADKQNVVHLYVDELRTSGGGTAHSVTELLQTIGNRANIYVVDRTEPSEENNILYYLHSSSRDLRRMRSSPEKTEKLKIFLTNLTEQTELQFEVAIRPVEIWLVTEDTEN